MRTSVSGLLVLAVLAGPLSRAVPQMKWPSLMLMQQAAEQGDPDAQFLIGLQYQVGDGVEKNPATAAKWLRLAAESGHAEAQHALGVLLAAQPTDPAHGEAEKWLRASADQGNAEAQYDLGSRYAQGIGVTHDTFEALRWYLQSAANGQVSAMKALGEMYGRGQGVAVDPVQALKWYRQAADLGDVEAKFMLDRIEAVKAAVTNDPEHSLTLWQEKAAQGDLGSILALGLMAAKTTDREEDPTVTVRWSLLLSGLRGAEAWLVRGYLLENGIAVSTDPEAAAANYRKAAEHGDTRGQYKLGLLYASGRGVAADAVEAAVWLSLAAATGSSEALEPLGAIKLTLTPEQKIQVGSLLRERAGLLKKKIIPPE